LLMGCTIRTDVPQHSAAFQPEWPRVYLQDFWKEEKKYRRRQKRNNDECHRSRPLPELLQYWLMCHQTVKFQEVLSQQLHNLDYILSMFYVKFST